MSDDPAIAEALKAIAAGDPVDWTVLESSAGGDASREILRGLRAVAGIAIFHRSLQESEQTSPPIEPNSGRATAADSGDHLAAWGSLTIVDEIGRGAFGRVYRAWDPRLDREVALKLLTGREAPDTSDTAVVVEEARLLARLRHSNIVAVHGADEIDGHVGIWMEFIRGATLDQIVRERGPLGAEEAMVIGRDVCRAVAAIHRAGLLHRDIKAQNVMRERGGRIVLMDFGAGREHAQNQQVSLAGTPLYLAPEVLGGQPSGPSSDLYSVGVLLYYLVTGAFPVTAENMESLRSAHSAGQRIRLRDARPDLAAGFVQVVDRALAANPLDRFESAGALEAALSSALGQDEPVVRAATSKQSKHWWRLTAALMATTLLVASLVAAWALSRPLVNDARTTSFVVPIEGERVFDAAISPDGSQIVFEVRGFDSTTRLFRRFLNDFQSTPIDGTRDGSAPFFSPNGQSLGFQYAGAPQEMRTIGLSGGPAVTLTRWEEAGGADWAGDDSIVFSSHDDLWRQPKAGGPPKRLTELDAGAHAHRPQVLPDGSVLFTRRQSTAEYSAVVLSGTGAMTTVLPDARNARYVPGYLIFNRGKWIMAAPFDARRLRVTGPAVQIQPAGFGAWFDVSAAGTLVYSTIGKTDAPLEAPSLVWVDRRSGHETPLPFQPQHFIQSSVRLSPNGRRVAVSISAEPPDSATDPTGRLWIGDVASGQLTPLTTTDAQPIAWTPDGARIAFINARGALVWRSWNGAEPEEELAGPENFPMGGCSNGAWSPNGRTLILRCFAPGMSGDLFIVSPPTGSTHATNRVERFLATPYGEGHPTMSPDGRWVAFHSNESGPQEIWVKAFPSGSVERVSTGGGNLPFWRGQELLYLGLSPRTPMVVPILRTSPSLKFGAPRPALKQFDYGPASGFEVSADGQRFLVLKGAGPPGATQLNVVVNWIAEVTRKVAAGK